GCGPMSLILVKVLPMPGLQLKLLQKFFRVSQRRREWSKSTAPKREIGSFAMAELFRSQKD
ncbi:MAG TPA: hypothetical protein PLJ65_05850, partial [Casimicrobium sp.]|nr:hypothetical protein [Casimicrobium sp.]